MCYHNVLVEEYVRKDGSSPFGTWFETLDPLAAAKVSVAVSRMEMGNTSNIRWFRGIGECRIHWGPGYRIYLARDGEALLVLLGGSTKKDQQPAIERALSMHAEYKSRKEH